MSHEALLWSELSQFLAAYWHEVDANHGARAHDFFLPDATFTTSLRTYTGQLAIKGFYDARHARGSRVSRHVVTNVNLLRVDGDRVELQWILLLFAADGVPVLDAAPPNLIADVTDTCQRTADGWRLSSRRIAPVFKGGAPTTG